MQLSIMSIVNMLLLLWN